MRTQSKSNIETRVVLVVAPGNPAGNVTVTRWSNKAIASGMRLRKILNPVNGANHFVVFIIFRVLFTPNAKDQRPGATGSRLSTAASSPGSLHPLVRPNISFPKSPDDGT